MSVGTGTAIAIGLGASTAASLAGAKMSSNAAKKAAQTQVDASNRALEQYQQINQPYLNAGASSMNTLARLMQPGQPYTPQQQRADVMGGPYASAPMMPGGLGASAAQYGGRPSAGAPTQRPGGPPSGMAGSTQSADALARLGTQGGDYNPNRPIGQQLGEPPSAFMRAMGPMGNMVKIQAPDGETRDVPRHLAQTYLARGGRVVG